MVGDSEGTTVGLKVGVRVVGLAVGCADVGPAEGRKDVGVAEGRIVVGPDEGRIVVGFVVVGNTVGPIEGAVEAADFPTIRKQTIIIKRISNRRDDILE